MILESLLTILLSPYIQFFILAVLAGLCRSDLEIPEQVTRAMSMYLMIAIGMKGGLALRDSGLDIAEFAGVLVAGVLIGLMMPVIGFWLLRGTTPLSRMDAAAIAAHYGSISVVTFSFAVNFLDTKGLGYAGYIVTLMALMEAPAIFAGILLARNSRQLDDTSKKRLLTGKIIRESLLNGSIVLLFGSMAIGLAADPTKLEQITPYLLNPFYAVLCVFLLELGLVTARQLPNVGKFPLGLLAFGIYMPLIGCAFGLGASMFFDLGVAETTLFATLCASASYIAVPAAMKVALPQANPALYVTSALAITFPFNLIIGVPLYYYLAKMVAGS